MIFSPMIISFYISTMKKLLLIALTISLAACSATKENPVTNTAETTVTETPNPGTAELDRRKGLFEMYCMRCHDLPDPASRTAEEWRKIVPEMAGIMNKKGPVIDAATEQDILGYLVAMSKAGDEK